MKLSTLTFTLLAATLFTFVSTITYAKTVLCPDETTASTYSACPSLDKPTEEAGTETEEEYTYEEEWGNAQSYKRLYYTFGPAGHYFVRKDGVGITNTFGVYSCFEYRFSKAFSLGFDTYYGWINGRGSQYLSSFNPGLKFFPMMYKNPKIEPFLFVGGHAIDAAFGGGERGDTSIGQGAFAGAGIRWYFGETRFGMEALVRASFMWMQRPQPLSGRAFSIPLFMVLGFAY